MAETVKTGRRPYRSEQRERQAAATRRQILDAARDRFVADGYYGTSIESIARAAGVAPRTVYAAYATKQDLLAALVETAIFGEDPAATSIVDRSWYGALAAARDADRLLELYGQVVCSVNHRVAPVQRVVRQAASSDARIAEIWARLTQQRLIGQQEIVGMLVDRGGLRTGLDAAAAADILWTLADAALYDDLCDRGWTDDRIGRWLGETFRSLLLGRAGAGRPTSPSGAVAGPRWTRDTASSGGKVRGTG